MEIIDSFCKSAEKLQYIFNPKKNSMDYKYMEIHRSRFNTDGSCLFNYELPFKDKEQQISAMKLIESKYPKEFTWRFNGENIEIIAIIPFNNTKHLGLLTRYKTITTLISLLRKYFDNLIGYKDINVQTYNIEEYIRATGSINISTQQFCVTIRPDFTWKTILWSSNHRFIETANIHILDIKKWSHEINPDIYAKRKKSTKKQIYDTIWEDYPVAIQNIAKKHIKNAHDRFILATYFLNVHSERDAKYQLFSCLTDDERYIMSFGESKYQWRTIVSREHPPPSPLLLISLGYANTFEDCFPKWGVNNE